METLVSGWIAVPHDIQVWLNRLIYWKLRSSCAAVTIAIVVAAVDYLFWFSRQPDLTRRRRIECLSSAKQISTALLMYTQDWNERLPEDRTWMDALSPYIKNDSVFRCPALRSRPLPAYGYAMSSKLSGERLPSIRDPEVTPWMFESTNWARNWSDDFDDARLPHRHGGTAVVGFATGRATFVRVE